MTRDRVMVRMVTHVPTGGLAEFAVIQETKRVRRGRRWPWQKVAVADSTHDDEVHVHRYGRRARDRIGEPEQLWPISTMADVEDLPGDLMRNLIGKVLRRDGSGAE